MSRVPLEPHPADGPLGSASGTIPGLVAQFTEPNARQLATPPNKGTRSVNSSIPQLMPDGICRFCMWVQKVLKPAPSPLKHVDFRSLHTRAQADTVAAPAREMPQYATALGQRPLRASLTNCNGKAYISSCSDREAGMPERQARSQCPLPEMHITCRCPQRHNKPAHAESERLGGGGATLRVNCSCSQFEGMC